MDKVATSELFSFTDYVDVVILSKPFLVVGSVSIAGNVENTDYSIDYRNGLLFPIVGGQLAINTPYTVAYSYKATKLETLVTAIQSEVTSYNEYPISANYTNAIEQAVNYLNSRIRFAGYLHLYVTSNRLMYLLPEYVFKVSDITDLNLNTLRVPSLRQQSVSAFETGSGFSNSTSKGWRYEQPYLVFTAVGTQKQIIKIRYYGQHELDSNNAYSYLTDPLKDLVLLKAKHLLLLGLASRAATEAIKYTLGDKDIDQTNQPIAFSSQAQRTQTEFENALQAFIGRITVS